MRVGGAKLAKNCKILPIYSKMMIDLIFEKYKIPSHWKREPLGTLYFILRKDELGYALGSSERQWLIDQHLNETLDFINYQVDYKNKLNDELRDEIRKLASNSYVHSSILTIPKTDSERAFVFYKVHNHEEINADEAKFVDDSYHRQIRLNKIKNKIGVIETVSYSTESTRIFSNIALGHVLSSQEYQWLFKNKIFSISDILLGQLSELLTNFQINKIEIDPQHQLLLCLILKKLDEEIVLDADEQSFLKTKGLDFALAVAQKTEFIQLKKKYQATEITDEEPSSHLFKVLKKISIGASLPDPDVNYLKKRKLHNTLKISFKPEADLLIEKVEQGLGLNTDDIEWCTRYGYPEIIFLSLKNEFEIYDSKHPMDSSLFGILVKLQSNQRLSDDDVVWLNTEKLFYSRSKIFITHHRIEATYCEDEFKRTKGYWNLVNASAHWRKAREPKLALKLTNNLAAIRSIKEAKLKAALFTTRGGALRDLDKLADAEMCALEAIDIFPSSHNPYTLMGALCYDFGKYDEGDKWFEKAIKRGAKPNDQDAEIRSILNKKSEKECVIIIAHLLAKDPIRFNWLKQYKPKHKKN